jgi:hypothetical protein
MFCTCEVHPAILKNDLGVAAFLLECQVHKKLMWEIMWEKEWSGGSKKDEEVYTIFLTTPEYLNLLPAVCTLIEVAGVQWMESATCERGFSIRTLTKTAQRYSLGDSLLAAVMMIDMNGN